MAIKGSHSRTAREREHEATRQALLRAGIELFGDRGFQATRIEDITERVDLAKGAFENYFDSKQTLLAQLTSKRE